MSLFSFTANLVSKESCTNDKLISVFESQSSENYNYGKQIKTVLKLPTIEFTTKKNIK